MKKMDKSTKEYYKKMHACCENMEQHIAFMNFLAILDYFHLEKEFIIDSKLRLKNRILNIKRAMMEGFFNEGIYWDDSTQGRRVWLKCHSISSILNYCTLSSVNIQIATNLLHYFVGSFLPNDVNRDSFYDKLNIFTDNNFHIKNPIEAIERFIQPYLEPFIA